MVEVGKKPVWAKGAKLGAGRISEAAKSQPASHTPLAALPWEAAGRLTVEALVNWAFGEQRVSASPVAGLCEIEALAAGYAWQGTSSDGVAAVERIGTVGCKIDISGPGRDMAHPVAEMVAHVVEVHPNGRVVREWAQLGVRPGGWGRRPVFVPAERGRDGDAMWVYDEAELPKRTGQQCPVVLMNSPEAVAAARRMYLLWWDVLAEVYVDVLAWPALPFKLEPVDALRVPWLSQRED